MKQIISFLVIALCIASCELNSEQEMALSRDVKAIFDARNGGDALMYLGLTHPSVVKHYQSLGDSAIKARFQQVTPNNQNFDRWYYQPEGEVFWQTHFQKGIQKKDDFIQVKMEVKLEENHSKLDSTIVLYAFSKDKGYNWLFVEERDYRADYYPSEHRLFD
jgi:hypothetical protein